LSKILKGYISGWVAISIDYKKVVASAPTMKELDKKLKKLGNPKVVLIPGMEDYGPIIATL